MIIYQKTIAGEPGKMLESTEISRIYPAEANFNRSDYKIEGIFRYPDFSVIQMNMSYLSHYSYFLISGNEAFLIDPGRDMDFYAAFAEHSKISIKGILLTHSHADFVAGHTVAAVKFNAPIYISCRANAGYDHIELQDGMTIKLNHVFVKALETPGHTLDGMCFAVYPRGGDDPEALFTGDTLLVGGLGRPDLMGGEIPPAVLGEKLFDVLHQTLKRFPDGLKYFPAHGKGSLCGSSMSDSDETFSTLGKERRENPLWNIPGKAAFVAKLLENIPNAPRYFQYDAAMNRKGPPPADWENLLFFRSPGRELSDPGKIEVIDVRPAERYAAGHVPNSLNISLDGGFETWTGTLVAPESHIVLVGDNSSELEQAVRRLLRIGYCAECLLWNEYDKSKLGRLTSRLIDPEELFQLINSDDAPLILDVRRPGEWGSKRLENSLNIPLPNLRAQAEKLDKNMPLVIVCAGGYRAAAAAGLMERHSFRDIAILNGGMENWIYHSLPFFRAGKMFSSRTV